MKTGTITAVECRALSCLPASFITVAEPYPLPSPAAAVQPLPPPPTLQSEAHVHAIADS